MVLSKAVAAFQQAQVRNSGSMSRGPSDYRYFTIAGMKKNYAVLPLVAIMGVAVVGITGYIVYACSSRPEVSFNRSKLPLADRMDMMNPNINKLAVINQQYLPMPELDAALKAREE